MIEINSWILFQIQISGDLFDAIVHLVGYGLISVLVGAVAAFSFRWYVKSDIPDGIPILLAVTVVAVWLNTQSALRDAIIGESPLLDPRTAMFAILAFFISAISADIGRRIGDRIAVDVGTNLPLSTARDIQDVGQVVRAAGRVKQVALPKLIDDMDGHDPVDPSIKTELSGMVMVFPRHISIEELRLRLIDRLQRDYGINYVAIDLTPNGTINSLAVGSRVAGVGPTLAPGTVAVAIHADPAFSASPGDEIEIWQLVDSLDEHDSGVETLGVSETELSSEISEQSNSARTTGEASKSPQRLGIGELRAKVDDVATIAVEESTASRLQSSEVYRIVTRPTSSESDREILSILRRSPEIMEKLPVTNRFVREYRTVGSISLEVLGIKTINGTFEPLPKAERVLETGEEIYVYGSVDAVSSYRFGRP